VPNEARTRSPRATIRPLEPVRDPRATVSDLLDVLLDKGVVLNLDLLISVADIPLVGVSVKAALAGIETMLEYGMMREWDEQTRAWVQRSLARHVPLAPGETLLLRMSGSCFDADGQLWRPGTVYLTDRRLLVFRREPPAVLLSQPLAHILDVRIQEEPTFTGERRVEVRLRRDEGNDVRVTGEDPPRLARRIRARLSGVERDVTPLPTCAPLVQGHLWYEEPRAVRAVWRAGRGVLDREAGLTWRGAADARPAVVLKRMDVREVRLDTRRTPAGRGAVIVETLRGENVFAAEATHQWFEALRRWHESEEEKHGHRR
jgi:gas vesicle protein GvpA/GvpJ/GvpM family